jgi:hypothetical protein
VNRKLALRVLTAGIVAYCLSVGLLQQDIAVLWVHALSVIGGTVMGVVVMPWLQRKGLL